MVPRIFASYATQHLELQILKIQDGGQLLSWKIEKWSCFSNESTDVDEIWQDDADMVSQAYYR